MGKFNKLIIGLFIASMFVSCKKEIEVQTQLVLEPSQTYFVQLYGRKTSDLVQIDGREFGDLSEFSSVNDSSAYVYAFKLAEMVRGESLDAFSNVNEFKLYNSQKIEITNSVSFEGIELYPNPYK